MEKSETKDTRIIQVEIPAEDFRKINVQRVAMNLTWPNFIKKLAKEHLVCGMCRGALDIRVIDEHIEYYCAHCKKTFGLIEVS